MKRYSFVVMCFFLCVIVLTGCGVRTINAEDTVAFLLSEGYSLMDRAVSHIENTNFFIFDQNNLEDQYLSNFYASQKIFYKEVYADMSLTFNATTKVRDYNIQTNNQYDLVIEGQNSWSYVIRYACLFSAVTKIVEFWDTDEFNQRMWFVIFKCYPKTNNYNYADKLFKLLKDINQVVDREGDISKNKAFSWALNREVNIEKRENCIALFTDNAAQLIR